jgi:hypothetical protein
MPPTHSIHQKKVIQTKLNHYQQKHGSAPLLPAPFRRLAARFGVRPYDLELVIDCGVLTNTPSYIVRRSRLYFAPSRVPGPAQEACR